MKRILIIIALIPFLLQSCGEKGTNDLTSKKEQLASLKKDAGKLAENIKTLEAEIAALDTSAISETKIKSIVSTPIQPEVFRHFVSVQGIIEAKENLMVTAKMPGMITSIQVQDGDYVTQGQLLCTLDDEIIRKSIDEVKSGLDIVNTMYEKQKALWDQKIGTEMQYLNLKNQKENLEKKLSTLQSQMSQLHVTAPFSGVIDDVIAKQGTMASPGVPLMQLVNTTALIASAKVPDSYVAFVKAGDRVMVTFPDLSKTIAATVSYVGRIVDPLSRTFKIEVKIPGGNPDLKPNLMALVQINDKTAEKAIVIQENIVQPTEDGKIVFVTGEEKGQKVAKLKKVTTGLSYNGKVEILSGLAPGENLITEGYQDLVADQLIAF